MIQHLIWIIGSVFVGVLQNVLVIYNAVVILLEILAMQAIKFARTSTVWLILPFPHLWRRRANSVALTKLMHTANSYEEFLHAARQLDQLEGGQAWREERETDEYDFELVEETAKRLRKARKRGDVQALIFSLRTIMSRSYGGIDRAALFKHAFCGTKVIIEKFVAEVIACLEAVASCGDISDEVKLEFFETCRLNVGRTALALSGGGALAMSHMGVVKTLIQAGLLPRVISGTSGGSIVAGMMAMHTDEELLTDIFLPSIVSRFNVKFFEPLTVQLWRFFTSAMLSGAPRMMDSEKFEAAVRAHFGNESFGSAFARTGRIVNITITVHYGGSSFPQALVLNYLTAPQVLLWSAVAASCALPGLMRPVTLMALDHNGQVVPYHPVAGVRSIDGSMHSDIPAEQMALMFHCNRTIVSQTNPHIVPFLKDSVSRSRHGSNILSRALYALEYWLSLDVQGRTKYLAKMRLLPKFFGAEFSNIFLQRYSGDVTIAPHQPLLSQWKALSQPTEADMTNFIISGQRATWPHIAHIRTLLGIEKKLSACARRFVAIPGALKHRPLWPAGEQARGRTRSGGVREACVDLSGVEPSLTGFPAVAFSNRVQSYAALRGAAPSLAASSVLDADSPVPTVAAPALDQTPDDVVVQEAANLAVAGGRASDVPTPGVRAGVVGIAPETIPEHAPAGDPSDSVSTSSDAESSATPTHEGNAGVQPPRASSPTLYWRGGHHVMPSYGNLSQLGSVVSSDKRGARLPPRSGRSASIHEGEDDGSVEVGLHFEKGPPADGEPPVVPLQLSFQQPEGALSFAGTPEATAGAHHQSPVPSSSQSANGSGKKGRRPGSVSFASNVGRADEPPRSPEAGVSPASTPSRPVTPPVQSTSTAVAGQPPGLFVIGSPSEAVTGPSGLNWPPSSVLHPRLQALTGGRGRTPMTPPMPPSAHGAIPFPTQFVLDGAGGQDATALGLRRPPIQIDGNEVERPVFPMAVDFSPTMAGLAERAEFMKRNGPQLSPH